ncbi:hypothetical protein T265_12265 [Opisthorchis viverrini]|uniref:Uncharacterized protein n=1 Tax=Opisthorchis viverrini TaxID=6198 RepID=A0A074YUK7_OPIVI|nr:hypothetical protein T265_12265 [Opisthorchis viverrini]KER18471.1 hypothetical protein T265_12265 [Opisthorchis viverrini]
MGAEAAGPYQPRSETSIKLPNLQNLPYSNESSAMQATPCTLAELMTELVSGVTKFIRHGGSEEGSEIREFSKLRTVLSDVLAHSVWHGSRWRRRHHDGRRTGSEKKVPVLVYRQARFVPPLQPR